jgi:hypothetical protein
VKLTLLLLANFICATPVIAQTHFHLDEPFKHPAKIPDGLVPSLRDEVESTCRADAAFQATDVRTLFSTSRITLNHHRPAFILKSGHHCLTGGDNDWFWIFLRTQKRYRKLLTGGTISVDVLKTKTRGMRDIETNGATARTNYGGIYKFNGSIYNAARCTESTPVEAKPKRVPCRQ